MGAFFRNQNIQFMTTLALVNAIIQIGNSIAAASSGGQASSGGADSLKKTMESLRDLLLPEDKVQKDSQAEKALKVLKDEVAKGALRVTAKSSSRRMRGKIKRGRREITSGSEPTES